ncbi:hypothetical protein CUZ56_00813 [Saezia sanguinis]|uniref:FimV N-terminal domain-containing protein n=1 Tax=Saezia sanguinis TaxID=1965230 RepID=A0A433SHW0_9BURK|nr:FimV/HubP family polar landmark protein [Saezia sanguinis]RUS68323.1 hypothetical protein CUZ56_00813 [Saezia sanguinis]
MNAISSKNRGVQGQPAKKHWRVTSAALAVALLAGGWSFSAQALVLGQIRVNSALGEPLQAEVPITQLNADEAASLQVRLASPGDFSSRGLIYSSAMSAIKVSFQQTGNTTAVIRLSSMRPVQDPFIDLLLDVSWRTGSMQRSYTMLVDPPASVTTSSAAAPAPQVSALQPAAVTSAQPTTSAQATAPAAPVRPSAVSGDDVIRERIVAPSQAGQAATVQPSQGGRVAPAAPAPQRQATPQQPRPQPAPVAGGDQWTVKVARGQTLGQIASAMKPAGVSNEQMLIALFRANPGAFINRNINWVKAGATLRIPSESEIASISQAEARSQVSQHARQFNDYRTQVARGSAPVRSADSTTRTTGGDVTPQPVQPAQPAQPIDQLQISSAQAPQDTQRAGQQQAANADARRTEIASNTDDLRRAQDALNNTPVAVAPTQQPAVVTPAPQPAPQPVPQTQPPLVVDPVPQPEPVPDTVPQPDPVPDPVPQPEPVPEVVPQPEPVPQPQPTPATTTPRPAPAAVVAPVVPPEKSLIDQLMDNPLIPVGGLAVIALIAFAGVKLARRKKNEDDDLDDDVPESTSQIDSFFADNISQQGAGASMLDQSSSLYAASQLDTNADVDPVQEADVYLAYGRDEQAAEILRDALQSDPNRIALHTKLCEVYARQGKVAQFDDQASQLRALTSGRGNDWVKIAKLGHSISPTNSLYSDAIETKNMNSGGSGGGGFAPQFAPAPNASEPEAPVSRPAQSAPQASAPSAADSSAAQAQPHAGYDLSGLSLDLPDDAPGSSQAAPSSIPDEDEGPATRLALAEEFLAIGNTDDAKEIVQEVLSENPSQEVQARAKALLDQT